MTAAIRYLDSFVKQDGTWLFDQRKLIVAWTETRPRAAVAKTVPVAQQTPSRPSGWLAVDLAPEHPLSLDTTGSTRSCRVVHRKTPNRLSG
jgi:hypothetical protein